MSDLVTLSEQLTDDEWLQELQSIGRETGWFRTLSRGHSAMFSGGDPRILLVGFDSVATARAGSSSGIPHTMLQAGVHGWSHLSLISRETSWFRDPAVYRFFDRLTDEGFFEGFSRVIFHGAGPCGYAAAAFSVAAPGAQVILAAPQATLDPSVAIWDDRFVSRRRQNFTQRYGYAPDMTDAAAAVYLIYDPEEELDAMHAALFRGPQIHHIRFRHGGPRVGAELQEMNLMGLLFKAAAAGLLTPAVVFRALRRRRDYMPYLRNVLNRVHAEERHYLTALLCRSVLRRKNAPRFRHHLELAQQRLDRMGKALPEGPVRKSSKLPPLRG